LHTQQCKLKTCAPCLQVHTLCIHFVQIFLHTQECELQTCAPSLQVHTLCIHFAYNVHSACIPLSVFQNGFRQTVFWGNRNVIHIDLNSFPDTISKTKLSLEVHAHHVHTIFGCMHTLFLVYAHFFSQLFGQVLQTPSQLLLIEMVLFHPQPFRIEPLMFYFQWFCLLGKVHGA
jgi:hypothetical protein